MDVGGTGGVGGGGNSSLPPPFLSKTYDMVDDASTDGVVSWSSGNNSFVVWNVAEFSRELLPKYFKHSNFSSFVRQLNTYGFRKVDPDRWEFANDGFLRGQKHLLRTINRRKAPHGNGPIPQIPTSATGTCVEVGKFGLAEEVERLKRDKNLLMQELVRLKQQQQSTDHQLQTAGQRVQMMEQRQQQMMSFLAKAMQSPGFMSQLVQQQNENNRRITSSSKKRRLPNQDELNIFRNYGNQTLDGEVTKFQPLLNEAAAAMLRQILNMNVSTQRESSMWKPDAYLLDDVSSSSLNAFDSGPSSSRLSEVTLAEVTPRSAQSSSQFEPRCSKSEGKAAGVHSPPHMVAPLPQPSQYPELESISGGDFSAVTDLDGHLGIPRNIVGQPGASFGQSGPMSGSITPEMLPGDLSPTHSNSDNLVDDSPKLPGIGDVFWEQFLSTSPLTGETDEMSSVLDDEIAHELDIKSAEEGIWKRNQHMDLLTEQMGFLTSEATIRR